MTSYTVENEGRVGLWEWAKRHSDKIVVAKIEPEPAGSRVMGNAPIPRQRHGGTEIMGYLLFQDSSKVRIATRTYDRDGRMVTQIIRIPAKFLTSLTARN